MSDNNYGTITDICVTTVPFTHDNLGRVGGYVADKLIS